MNGPQHYRRAGELLAEADAVEVGGDHQKHLMAMAQVHATLALAAATAMPVKSLAPLRDINEWRKAMGERS